MDEKGNVGSVFWSSKDFYPIDTVYFVDAPTSNLYLYYALKHMHFISTDVAVPGLIATLPTAAHCWCRQPMCCGNSWKSFRPYTTSWISSMR